LTSETESDEPLRVDVAPPTRPGCELVPSGRLLAAVHRIDPARAASFSQTAASTSRTFASLHRHPSGRQRHVPRPGPLGQMQPAIHAQALRPLVRPVCRPARPAGDAALVAASCAVQHHGRRGLGRERPREQGMVCRPSPPALRLVGGAGRPRLQWCVE